MKIYAIMWGNMLPAFSQAGAELPWLKLQMRSMRDMGNRENRDEFLTMARRDADLLLLVPATGQTWEEIKPQLPEIGQAVPVVSLGPDPSLWSHTTVISEIAVKANGYLSRGGPENIRGLLCYLGAAAGGLPLEVPAPVELPWQGIYYPGAPAVFSATRRFLPVPAYRPGPAGSRAAVLPQPLGRQQPGRSRLPDRTPGGCRPAGYSRVFPRFQGHRPGQLGQ